MTTTAYDTTELAAAFGPSLVQPADATYDEVRRVHNGMIDRRPALIARCRGTADIVQAVNFARDNGLEIAIRGGGHNVAGNAVCDGGMMIDLSPMKGIHVDPQARIARAQGGVLWEEFNRETCLHGLAVTGGEFSTTGIAGLTLGGGVGYLMGRHGLTCDNLRSVELVTAAGDVLAVNAESHPDLFWALRGGGGNFGVAASFEYDLHPVGPLVMAGFVAHPFERAREVLEFYREFTRSLPDDLVVWAGLLTAPDGSGAKLAVIMSCHAGPLDAAEADVRPIKEFAEPALDTLEPKPYPIVNSMLNDGMPRGALNYWKSSFLKDVDDDAVGTLIDRFEQYESNMGGLVVEHFHGAATRVPVAETAFPHRAVGHNLLVAAEWSDPAATDATVAWARETFAAMEPHFASGGYSNYFSGDETEDRVAAAYGPSYERLREVKRRYDPDNLFHLNQNIRP